MFRWILGLWYAKCRNIDIEILWPICVRKAPTLDHAKAAFAVHAGLDPAWQILGEKGIIEAIDKLEA